MFRTIAIVAVPMPDPARVLLQRPVVHPVHPIGDAPMAAGQPQQRLRPGSLARQARVSRGYLGLDLRARLAHLRRAEHLHAAGQSEPRYSAMT